MSFIHECVRCGREIACGCEENPTQAYEVMARSDGEVEKHFRIHVWNALRAEVSIADDACYRVINRSWEHLKEALHHKGTAT